MVKVLYGKSTHDKSTRNRTTTINQSKLLTAGLLFPSTREALQELSHFCECRSTSPHRPVVIDKPSAAWLRLGAAAWRAAETGVLDLVGAALRLCAM